VLSDTGNGSSAPSIEQLFAQQATPVDINFDFMLPTASLSSASWNVSFLGVGSNFSPFIFQINDSFDLTNASGTPTSISTISGNQWYNVSARYDPTAETVSGALTPFSSSPISFSDSTSTSGFQFIQVVGIYDGIANTTNSNIHFDNISVSAVPEPSSFLMLAIVGAGVAVVRRRRKYYIGK